MPDPQDPVQSLMSVMVPVIGILLVRDLRRAPRAARLIPTLLAGTLLAAVIGVFGVAISTTGTNHKQIACYGNLD